MKRLLSLLLVMILLCGCGTVSQQPITTVPQPDIMDQKTPLDDLGAFYDTGIALPMADIEPNIYMVEEDLLLLYLVYEQTDDFRLMLYRINTRTGETVCQATIPSKGFGMVQVYGDTVCLSSAPTGKLWILDGGLNIKAEYTFSENYNEWFVSPDLKTLYQTGWDSGLQRYTLADGSCTALLPPESEVSCYQRGERTVVISYVDPKTQMTLYGVLDLASGEVTPLNVEGDFCAYVPEKDLWLGTLPEDSYTCILGGNGRETQQFTLAETYSTLTPRGEILSRNYQSGRISVYNTDGKLCSALQLPMGEFGFDAYISGDMVWDAARNGYFLTYTDFRELPAGEDPEAEPQTVSILAFLQLHDPKEEGSLTMAPYAGDTVPVGSAVEQALFDRAEALGERFGVQILIADQCTGIYDDFKAELVTDAQTIDNFLTELETALSKYPNGFLSQLTYGTIRQLEFSVVGKLTPVEEDEYGASNAFAQPLTDKYIIVADAYSAWDTTIHHELSHVLDHRLQWDAEHRADALYSEDRWASMNPDDFTYDMSYMLHQDRWDFNDRYFMSSYACTYPTEDRATIWEQAMVGNDYPFRDGPMREKLKYYSDCVRDCMDTTGWPAVLPWETVLQ